MLDKKYMLILILFVASCSTSQAPEFPTQWRPVNIFPKKTTEIPLYTPYIYRARKTDVTVKNMLQRWANDNNIPLHYRHRSDFTINQEAGNMQHLHIADALSELNAIYYPQQIRFYLENGYIVADIVDQPSVETTQVKQPSTQEHPAQSNYLIMNIKEVDKNVQQHRESN